MQGPRDGPLEGNHEGNMGLSQTGHRVPVPDLPVVKTDMAECQYILDSKYMLFFSMIMITWLRFSQKRC